MKRISKGSVTEALMEAMEKADELDQVLILYRYKDSGDTEHLGCSSNDELTVRDGNWLVDVYKNWVTESMKHE
jgi:hypothetical protein